MDSRLVRNNSLVSGDSFLPFTNPSLFLLNLSPRQKIWMLKQLVLLGGMYVALPMSLVDASFDSVLIFAWDSTDWHTGEV